MVVTRLDHDANIRPWVQCAERAGVTVRWADFDPETGELDPHAVGGLLTDRTRLVAVTAASNLIGTRPDLPAIADLVHGTPALLFVDGVHHTAHVGVDMRALGADLFTCSPYKFMGPHCGVLAAAPELLETLEPDKLLPLQQRRPGALRARHPAVQAARRAPRLQWTSSRHSPPSAARGTGAPVC